MLMPRDLDNVGEMFTDEAELLVGVILVVLTVLRVVGKAVGAERLGSGKMDELGEESVEVVRLVSKLRPGGDMLAAATTEKADEEVEVVAFDWPRVRRLIVVGSNTEVEGLGDTGGRAVEDEDDETMVGGSAVSTLTCAPADLPHVFQPIQSPYDDAREFSTAPLPSLFAPDLLDLMLAESSPSP